MTNATGRSLVLPVALDLNAAAQLKQELQEARAAGEAISIDAGNVQRLCSLCLQLLLAAKADPSNSATMSIDACSQVFRDMATELGFAAALGISGESHG